MGNAEGFDLLQHSLGLHALGHQHIADIVHHAGEIGHYLAGTVVFRQFFHQRYVEFDDINRQVDQVA